jgi:hypothetical protein
MFNRHGDAHGASVRAPPGSLRGRIQSGDAGQAYGVATAGR